MFMKISMISYLHRKRFTLLKIVAIAVFAG